MNEVYVVVCLDNNDLTIDIEVYDNFFEANDRALFLAKEKYLDRYFIEENPGEIRLSNGSIWCYLNNSECCVSVRLQPIQTSKNKVFNDNFQYCMSNEGNSD